MTEDFVRQQLELEDESLALNQLNTLGNQAVALGLIAGHGYHQGQYEILRQGQALLMSPEEAVDYLRTLIQSTAEDA